MENPILHRRPTIALNRTWQMAAPQHRVSDFGPQVNQHARLSPKSSGCISQVRSCSNRVLVDPLARYPEAFGVESDLCPSQAALKPSV